MTKEEMEAVWGRGLVNAVEINAWGQGQEASYRMCWFLSSLRNYNPAPAQTPKKKKGGSKPPSRPATLL